MSADDGIKLVYFGLRGRAEFIRLLLHAAEQPFEDVHIPRSEWPGPYRAETPYGQVPYIIYKGKKYGQSLAIGSFFARKFGFYGKSDVDGLRVDEVCQLTYDLRAHIRGWRMAQNKEEMMKTLREETQRYMSYFETLLKENGDTGYFVSDSLSVADLIVFDLVNAIAAIDSEKTVSGFPCLQKLQSNVKSFPPLQEYLSRPPLPP